MFLILTAFSYFSPEQQKGVHYKITLASWHAGQWALLGAVKRGGRRAVPSYHTVAQSSEIYASDNISTVRTAAEEGEGVVEKTSSYVWDSTWAVLRACGIAGKHVINLIIERAL